MHVIDNLVPPHNELQMLEHKKYNDAERHMLIGDLHRRISDHREFAGQNRDVRR